MRRHGVDAEMWVGSKSDLKSHVVGPRSMIGKYTTDLRSKVVKPLTKTLRTQNQVLHSPSVLPSSWPYRLNKENPSIAHLHWVQSEFLSIADIGKLSTPLVWTFHDMWPFCGAEHYTTDERWKHGYTSSSRPAYEGGFDLNKWCWNRKLKNWARPAHVITPSSWLAECVRASRLLRDWPVTVIPNCIDTDLWAPHDKTLARSKLGLPKDVPLLLFGADGGTSDPRKGFDLLRGALQQLKGQIPELELVIFGSERGQDDADLGFTTHFSGEIKNDLDLCLSYSACDAMVIPSRQDNLPNTALESLACGTPVVAFDVGGLPDIVDHKKNGALAKPFNVEDLAAQIQWVIDKADSQEMAKAAREKVLKTYSEQSVVRKHLDLYSRILD